MAERLRSDPCFEGATLFVWGYAAILQYETRLPPASRFVVLPQSRLTGYVSGNFASLEARGPEAPEDCLTAHYEDAGTVDRVRLYRRRGCRTVGDGGGVPADRE